MLEDITDDQVQTLCAIVGPTFVPKLRALDAIAAKRGRRTEVIRDTFLERNFAENASLQIINCNTASAPKWATSMEEGDRYVSEVGILDSKNNLVMVGKLSRPIRIANATTATIEVTMDF